MKWAAVVAAGAALMASAAQVQDRKITEVIKLLEEMMETSKEDGKNDRKIYAKLKCYCDTNTEEKTKAIEENSKEKLLLEGEIEKLLGSSGKLSSEVAQLQADMEANEQARKEATEIREKEKKAFVELETDHEAAISNMKEAIETLAEIGADQTAGNAAADHDTYMKEFAFMSKKVNVHKIHLAVEAAFDAASARLSAADKKVVKHNLAAMQTKGVLNEAYTSQSGEIIGILKSMLDTFSSNLAEARATETAAIESHDKFMETKLEEYNTMNESKITKEDELGQNDTELATARDSLAAVEDMLAEDQEFLAQLTDMCSEKKKQYDTKTTLRTEEEAAIAQAIAILNSDGAFDTFGKVDSTNFVQIKKHASQLNTEQSVMKMLLAKAQQTKSLKLAKVAVFLQAGNPFATVLAKIRKMIEVIIEEEKMDDEKKAWCDDERETNNKTLKKKKKSIKKMKASILELKNTIKETEESLATAETDLATNLESQKTATETRAEEKAAYDEDYKNLVDAQNLLGEAIKVLDEFYSRTDLKVDEAELAKGYDALTAGTSKTKGRGDDAHEGKDFADANTAGGKEVLNLLETIKNDTKKEEEEATTAENDAIAKYEEMMEELKSDEKTLTKNIAEFEETIATTKESLLQTEEDLSATIADKEAIEAYLLKIKPGCDFIDENIETRKKNRTTEKAALEKAIELLEGSPAFTNANTKAYHESLGECKEVCEADSDFRNPCQNGDVQCSAKCEACLSGTSVPAYCTSHQGADGC